MKSVNPCFDVGTKFGFVDCGAGDCPRKYERNIYALLNTMVEIAVENELLALRWQDVDLLRGRLEVRSSLWRGRLQRPKTKSRLPVLLFGWLC